jgi:uncharacterized membrane protein YcaP (DUF421 family)
VHEPALLFQRGSYNEAILTKEQIVHEEVRQAPRAHGLAEKSEVYAVILEPDGSINVLKQPQGQIRVSSLDAAVP